MPLTRDIAIKAGHTPTPWHCRFARWDESHPIGGMAIFGTGKHPDAQPIAAQNYAARSPRGVHADYPAEEIEANAAYIVRAVNAHEALVAALAPFAECGENESPQTPDSWELAVYFSDSRHPEARRSITLGHCRAAARALSLASGEGK